MSSFVAMQSQWVDLTRKIAPQSRLAIGISRAIGFAVLGFLLAFASWGEGRSPAPAIVLPLLWCLAPSRLSAFALCTAYHLGVVRFLPGYAGTWFGSELTGAAIWAAMGSICGLGWALCWTGSKKASWNILAVLAAIAVTLLSPVAGVLPGHPLVAWGFLLPGTGWVGVGLMVILSTAGVWALRVQLPSKLPSIAPYALFIVFGMAIAAGVVGMQPGGEVGKVAGKIGAVTTRLGGPPPPYSMDVMERVEKIGIATAQLAGGEDGLDTVIFPETIIGMYDPSLYPVLEGTILRKSRPAGQTVVIGADLQVDKRNWQTVALIFRPNGTSTYVASRQPPPAAMWTPWSNVRHYPANWLADNTVNIGGGVRARIMFCYEEYIPILHLIDEARYEHHLVVAMSNLWPATDNLANVIQSSHTQGMALLFGKRWIRAANLTKSQQVH